MGWWPERAKTALSRGLRALTAQMTFVGAALAQDPGAACWDQVLHQHVRGGRVDYAALRANPAPLQACLAELAAVRSTAGWTVNQRIAFWVNVYNAFTVDLVVDNPGIQSIRDIGWPLSSPWKQPIVQLGLRATPYTLDEVEHQILRVEFDEPRVHVALVCASVSCPALRPEAYVASRLDTQLSEQARAFLADPTRNRTTPSGLALSKVFDWYGADFASVGGVRGFITKWGPPEMAQVAATATITWQPYDWSLNGR